MAPLLLIVVLVVPGLLVTCFSYTRLFWLPGTALLSLGAITLATMPRGIEMFVARVHEIVGLGLVGYGAVLLVLARWLHARAQTEAEMTLEPQFVPVASNPKPTHHVPEPMSMFMPCSVRRATTAGRAITAI